MVTIFWIYVGIVSYFVAYLVFGCGCTAIWKCWATNKVGIFWRYSVGHGMSMYYPEMYFFVQNYTKLYNVVYVAFWPVMLPMQLTMMTKSLNRLSERRYYY